MSWLASGAHNSGVFSFNFDISTPDIYNGLIIIAYGFPYNN
jgi:hypothetical protein